MAHAHPLAIDALVAAVLLAVCTVWLVQSPFASLHAGLVQAALIAVIAVRRVWPVPVFLAAAAIGFAQWLLGFPLLGDVALLIALYTVAAHQSRTRALAAAAVLEAGAVMAVGQLGAGRHAAALAGVPDRHRGGRAVRRADGRFGQPLPGLDGRARPAAGGRA